MEQKVILKRITIFPIKSLPGVSVNIGKIDSDSGLMWDRKWAFFKSDGRYLNGKNENRIHLFTSKFDLEKMTAALSFNGETEIQFSLNDFKAISHWISDQLGEKINFRGSQNHYSDDQKAPGPTLISEASLKRVGQWFELDIEEVRRRFRANLEISGCPPFWEDTLLTQGANKFCIGGAKIIAANACKRCVVPTRDSATGNIIKGFTNRFIKNRQKEKIKGTEAFDHYYRLSINTQIEEPEKNPALNVGDELIRLP